MYVTATLDFWVGRKIQHSHSSREKKAYLWFSVVANLSLLAYFKYFGLFLDTIHAVLIQSNLAQSETILLPALRVILPAGISFLHSNPSPTSLIFTVVMLALKKVTQPTFHLFHFFHIWFLGRSTHQTQSTYSANT